MRSKRQRSPGRRAEAKERPKAGWRALRAAFWLLLGASGIAAYLAWNSFGGHGLPGCGPQSGCDKVLNSKWAYWLGFPVSALAIPIYLGVGVAAFRLKASPDCKWAWRITMGGALLLSAVAVWFAGIQWLVIKATCPFCMGAHVLGLAAAGLLLWGRREVASEGKRVPPVSWAGVAAASLVAVAGLMVGQVLYRPEAFAVTTIASGFTNGRPAEGASPQPGKRMHSIYGGQFQLAVDELPMIGPVSAQHLIVSLFDFTCRHCREMHEVLLKVQQTFSNRLGIVSLPVPLDPACNANIKYTIPDHAFACEYARIALAVWRAQPSVFAKFEHWLFAPERPPPLEEARRYAAELVGVVGFEAALSDPWINAQIQRDVEIYATALRAGRGSLPQLIIGSKVAVSTVPSAMVYKLLEEELGLKAPPGK